MSAGKCMLAAAVLGVMLGSWAMNRLSVVRF